MNHSTPASTLNFKKNMPLPSDLRALLAIILVALGPAISLAQQGEPSLKYTVRPSDNLTRLSREMLTSPNAWNEVARYNQLKNANRIVPGQQLDIPLRFLRSQPANGRVISAHGEVTLAGQPVQPGALLSDGSQLKTGVNSSAVLELGDGSRIKLLPGSLAEVVSSRNYAMRDASASGSTNWFSGLMRLTTGALEAIAAKSALRATPLQVETPTSVIGVRGTEFRVAVDSPALAASGTSPASTSARTEVLEGLVRADNPAQQAGADLPVGTGAVIRPTDKQVKAVALLPAPDAAGLAAEVFKPAGNWPLPALAGAAAFRVQVASDAQFDTIVRDFKVGIGTGGSDIGVSAAEWAGLASLDNGNWYARVRGIDAEGLEGFNAVKLIAVRDGQWRVSYSTLSLVNGQSILEWSAVDAQGKPMLASGYTVQLARDAAIGQLLLSQDTETPRMVLVDLKPGMYFLRLRSKLVQGGTLDGGSYRLQVPGDWGQTVFEQISALQPLN